MMAAAMLAGAALRAEPPSVQAMLDAAVREGASELLLPSGRVPVEGALKLENADGLTIRGDGTTLVFMDHRGTGWSFYGCRDLALRDFAVDYDPVPFVQGRIASRSDDGKIYEFTVAEGYPGLRDADARYYRQAYIFEPDVRRWKPWVPDIYAREVEILSERQGRFIMGYAPAFHELIRPGDRIVLTIRSGAAMRMNNCENVRLEDITFYAAAGAAYLGRYMRGDNYYRYTIEPGPPPPGAAEPRLLSTCADGLNIAFATKGPTIDKCRFSFMGDDSVNLHGVTFAVLAQESPTELIVGWPYSREWLASVIPVGAQARRLAPGNYAVLGNAAITSFASLETTTEDHLELIHGVWPRNREGRGTAFRLKLAGPLPAMPGEFIDVPANNCPGFVIRDCVFEDHRARGLRIMASDGVIERNTFRRLKMCAISLGPEYVFWREAGWVNDVTVRENRIEDVGRDGAMVRASGSVRGAIALFGARERGAGDTEVWRGNRDIVIENNVITGCPVAGIQVTAAKNVTLRNNELEYVGFGAPGEGTGERQDARAVDIRFAENVEIQGGAVRNAGARPPEMKPRPPAQ
jgi:hypothetical protein